MDDGQRVELIGLRAEAQRLRLLTDHQAALVDDLQRRLSQRARELGEAEQLVNGQLAATVKPAHETLQDARVRELEQHGGHMDLHLTTLAEHDGRRRLSIS